LEPTHGPQPDPDIRLVTVFATDDPGLVAIVKSLLDEAGIDHFVPGETLRNVMGWGTPGPFGLGSAEFQVREEDADRATELLSQLTDDR
jgi:hypothetical protein